jgi:hypothetical protein
MGIRLQVGKQGNVYLILVDVKALTLFKSILTITGTYAASCLMVTGTVLPRIKRIVREVVQSLLLRFGVKNERSYDCLPPQKPVYRVQS